MKRNPGQWLRNQLLDRTLHAWTLFTVGIGCLLAVLLSAMGGFPNWFVILFGVVLCLAGVWVSVRGLGTSTKRWRLNDIRKGARSEERIGAAIEYALTQPNCAVAHGVMEIAKVGDIDHLVVTPQRIWVVESKYSRLPKHRFPETLRRIAANVDAVSEWAPGAKVVGCLVFGGAENVSANPSYTKNGKRIFCFKDPESLARQLRKEAGTERAISEEVARKVWRVSRTMDSE